MHWKSLSRPKFEMVNGGGLLQVPTAFSGRYVEFVQSSAFGHKQPLGGASGSGRRLPRPAHCIKASINGQVGGAGVGA